MNHVLMITVLFIFFCVVFKYFFYLNLLRPNYAENYRFSFTNFLCWTICWNSFSKTSCHISILVWHLVSLSIILQFSLLHERSLGFRHGGLLKIIEMHCSMTSVALAMFCGKSKLALNGVRSRVRISLVKQLKYILLTLYILVKLNLCPCNKLENKTTKIYNIRNSRNQPGNVHIIVKFDII